MDKMVIDIQCPFCGDEHSVVVIARQYSNWQRGELIQNAMPMLSSTEREQLISSICPDCQDDVFNSEI